MHVICVESQKDEREAFRKMASVFSDIDSIRLFADGKETLGWLDGHQVDLAFIAMQLPDIHGLELAQKLIEADADIRVVFLTAFGEYALQAFGVGAIGYVLKPYCQQDLKRELDKAKRFSPVKQKNVSVQTMPDFLVLVDGRPLISKHRKAMELLALLIDRRGNGISSGEAIAYLWPDRTVSDALFRVTWKRLSDILEQSGIGWLAASKGKLKYILADRIECDLYRILDGDSEAADRYAGEYLREFEWSESRNAQLSQMLGFY